MTAAFDRRFRDAPAGPDAAGLQVLFPDPPDLPAEGLRAALREYHPSFQHADAEFGPAPAGSGAAYAGLLTWADHAVKLLAYAGPMPDGAADVCLRPALLPPDVKDEAAQHRGHSLLYYAGSHTDPFEQIVAVAAAAGVLARFGGFVTLHEAGRTAILSHALLPDDADEDMLNTLRTLPLPYLYAGFSKMELGDTAGVWVRTFAAHKLGLPDLAQHVAGHEFGRATFGLFAGVFGYLRETGLALIPGELVRVGEGLHLLPREPKPAEWWLDSPGPVLVLEEVQP